VHPPLLLFAPVAAFLEMMAAERGAAANTLAAYARDLARGRRGRQSSGRRRRGLTGRAGRGVDPIWRPPGGTAAAAAVHGLCPGRGLREDDPAVALACRARGALAALLTRNRRFLETAEADAAGGTPEACGLLALVELLYGSGLRASELVGLPLRRHCRATFRFLAITGKGAAAAGAGLDARAGRGAGAVRLEAGGAARAGRAAARASVPVRAAGI
jgi:integrase/recombinase XerD